RTNTRFDDVRRRGWPWVWTGKRVPHSQSRSCAAIRFFNRYRIATWSLQGGQNKQNPLITAPRSEAVKRRRRVAEDQDFAYRAGSTPRLPAPGTVAGVVRMAAARSATPRASATSA